MAIFTINWKKFSMHIGNMKALQMNAKFPPSDSPSFAMNKLNVSCVGEGGGAVRGADWGPSNPCG